MVKKGRPFTTGKRSVTQRGLLCVNVRQDAYSKAKKAKETMYPDMTMTEFMSRLLEDFGSGEIELVEDRESLETSPD